MNLKFVNFALLFTLFFANTYATEYLSQDTKSTETAIDYLKTSKSLSRLLGYRDIPAFIEEYAPGKRALDHGAGTGFSTQFLTVQGLDVIGVDVSEPMLAQAKTNCPSTRFYLIKDGEIPLESDTFDLVFSSLVLFELGSEEDMLAYLNEAKRVLKDDGVFIALTGSEHMYSKNWLIFNSDYPENRNLKSGDLAKIYLKDAGIEFTDFYWTESDYRHFFKEAGFDLVKVHYPLGQADEGLEWKEETTLSPFVVFIAKKSVL